MSASALPPIGLMAFAAFTTGSGMRLLDPLLPMVAGEFGVPVSGAAWLVAGFLLPYGVGQLGFGPLGDRYGKLRVACLAVLAYAVLMLASAFAGTLGALTWLRVGAGFAAGAVIPLLIAHLGDAVPYAERQAVLGRFSTGMVLAQIITGPAAGVLAEIAGWRATFALLGLLAAAAGAVMVWRLGLGFLRAPAAPGRGGSTLAGYAALLAKRTGRWLVAVAFLNGFLLFGGVFPYVGAFLVERFGLSAGGAGVVVAGFGLGALAYTRMARKLVRRYGERRLLLRGGMGLGVGLCGLALAPHWAWVLLMQLGLGLAFYCFHGVLQARATEALPEARGTAVAGFALALFLGQSVGSLAFGAMIGWAGYPAVFGIAGAGVAALAAWARLGIPVKVATRAPG